MRRDGEGDLRPTVVARTKLVNRMAMSSCFDACRVSPNRLRRVKVGPGSPRQACLRCCADPRPGTLSVNRAATTSVVSGASVEVGSPECRRRLTLAAVEMAGTHGLLPLNGHSVATQLELEHPM
jgi:hypothetical protein